MSIKGINSKAELLNFIRNHLQQLVLDTLTVNDLTVPANSSSDLATPPVDFEQVGGLVIGETIIPDEESISNTFSWTLSAPPSNAQDWHPSSNNDFFVTGKIVFVVPASGHVEIQVRCSLDAGAANDRIYLRLCTDFNGTSLATRYQKMVLRTNAQPECVLTQVWALVGLTPGTLTTYYLGAAADSGTHYIKAGGTCTGDTDVTTEAWPQFIMRAVAVQSNAN